MQQLQPRQYYLHLYLDALFLKDTHLTSDFADLQVSIPWPIVVYLLTSCRPQVKLYAEYAPKRLIDFLRASNYYNLEQVSCRRYHHLRKIADYVGTGIQSMSRARPRTRDGLPTWKNG